MPNATIRLSKGGETVIPVQPDQVESALDAISQTAQAANQYILGFMLLIFLFMVLGGVVVAIVISRAANKYIDANIKRDSGDNTVQSEILKTWAQAHIDSRDTIHSVNRIADQITPMVQNISVLAETMRLSAKQTTDGITEVSGTVAMLSGRVGNVEGKMGDFGGLLEDVVERLNGIEFAVKAADCEPHTKRILDAIETAKRDIIEFRPEPPPTPNKDSKPANVTPLNADGAATKATLDDDLPIASGE